MINEDLQEYWCYRCIGFSDKDFCERCQKKTFFEELKKKFSKLTYKVGDRIKFPEEKRAYKIRACNERFIIATKPYNPKKTFLYTIVDLKHLVRGADNYKCLYNYINEKEAKRALTHLMKSKSDRDFCVSFRNFKKILDLEIISEKAV